MDGEAERRARHGARSQGSELERRAETRMPRSTSHSASIPRESAPAPRSSSALSVPLVRGLRRAWIELAPRLFARLATPDDPELGLLGERLAELDLAARGFRIDARRRRSAEVEIDLVAREGARIVLVEVKTKRVEPLPRLRGAPRDPRAELAAALRWRPGWRFDAARRDRLEHVARRLARPGAPPPRVDLVEVFVGPRGRPLEVLHHRGRENSRSG